MDNFKEFLDQFHAIIATIGWCLVGLIPLIYILYSLRAATQSTLKAKYDFVYRFNRPVWKVINVFFALLIFCLVNLYNYGSVSPTMVHFLALLGISVVVGVTHVYISFMYLNIYYMKRLDMQLRKIRYTPRINPKTGNPMRLLAEEDEDVYLDEGMQAEEAVFSVDYDVWIDEKTGDTHIERYEGRNELSECSYCGFKTLRLFSEALADEGNSREVLQHYKCTYCKKEIERVVCAKDHNKGQGGSALVQDDIQKITLQLYTQDGVETQDFDTLQELRDFTIKYQALQSLASMQENAGSSGEAVSDGNGVKDTSGDSTKEG